MSWKKAICFGGAVLVLAACDNATAPTSPSALTKLDPATASATQKKSTTTTATPTNTAPNTPTLSDCTQVIHVGLDGSLITTCAPTIW